MAFDTEASLLQPSFRAFPPFPASSPLRQSHPPAVICADYPSILQPKAFLATINTWRGSAAAPVADWEENN